MPDDAPVHTLSNINLFYELDPGPHFLPESLHPREFKVENLKTKLIGLDNNPIKNEIAKQKSVRNEINYFLQTH